MVDSSLPASSTGAPPQITPLVWSSAKEVLPHEAHDFTPWLAKNLDLLADVLGLDELELEATEWKVETFALDILARGSDADGDVKVVIENQYGATDHRHLGQLLTYAAHAAAPGHRVLAVWVVEEVRSAHLAAVDLLNRVAAAEASTFGMVLLRVMFAPAPVGWHVHFEVESEPNAFLKARPPGNSGGGSTETAAARADFIDKVVALLDGPMEKAGFRRSGGINRKHGAVIYKFPPVEEISKVATARVVCSRDTVNVALYVEHYPTSAQNWAVSELLRQAYTPHLEGYGLLVDDWHGSNEATKRDRIITALDIGYQTGAPKDVATQAAAILERWAKMVADHPIPDIQARIAKQSLGGVDPN